MVYDRVISMLDVKARMLEAIGKLDDQDDVGIAAMHVEPDALGQLRQLHPSDGADGADPQSPRASAAISRRWRRPDAG